jgi:hypothetical protein
MTLTLLYDPIIGVWRPQGHGAEVTWKCSPNPSARVEIAFRTLAKVDRSLEDITPRHENCPVLPGEHCRSDPEAPADPTSSGGIPIRRCGRRSRDFRCPNRITTLGFGRMNRIQIGGIGSVYARHRYSAEKPEDHGGGSCGYYGARRGWAN